MLGWHISAYRFGDEELRSARCELESMVAILAARAGCEEIVAPREENLRLAVWQTWLGGTAWLDALVAAGEAEATYRGGYPNTYLIPFGALQTQLERGLLKPGQPWRSGPGDTFLANYVGRDTAFENVLEATGLLEWIVVQAWDES